MISRSENIKTKIKIHKYVNKGLLIVISVFIFVLVAIIQQTIFTLSYIDEYALSLQFNQNRHGRVLAATEFLVNGSFENIGAGGKLANWKMNYVSFTVNTAVVHAGVQSVQMKDTHLELYTPSVISDPMTLEPGDYTLSFWIKTEDLGANGAIKGARGALLNSGNVSIAATTLIAGTHDWQLVQKDFTLSTSGSYRIALQAYSMPSGTAWFDEVSLTQMAVSDTIPSAIFAINAINLTSSSADINWTTDKASDGQVEYGLTSAYGQSSILNPNLLTSHLGALTGLLANTPYHFRVKSRDAIGNLTVSSDQTFTTLNSGVPPPPPPSPQLPPVSKLSGPQCSDGIDNDYDGKMDYGTDTGCADSSDTDEFDASTPPNTNPKAGGIMWQPVFSRFGPNLLNNGGFELVTAGKPSGWTATRAVSADALEKRTGTISLTIEDAKNYAEKASAYENIPVKKGHYRMRGWIKHNLTSASSLEGVRIAMYTGGAYVYGGATTKTYTNSNGGWEYFELPNIYITQDTMAKVSVESYYNAGGSFWVDDLELVEEYPFQVQTFLLYPNYRGMLFDDQSQNILAEVIVDPEPGRNLSEFEVKIGLMDETSGNVVLQNTFPAQAKFMVNLNGGGLATGNTYLLRTSLFDKTKSETRYEYAAHRISKVAAGNKATMTAHFDEQNRFMVKGQPKFLIGVYDHGLQYYTSESGFENTFSVNRRLFELPMNVYLNYGYGRAPTNSMKLAMNVLQRDNILYFTTGNSNQTLSPEQSDGGNHWLTKATDADIMNRGAHPGLLGWYLMDESPPYIAPAVFKYHLKIRNLDPDSITFAVSTKPSDLDLWKDTVDVVSTDPYPLYGTEPIGGYKFNQVADWTKATKEAVRNSRPFMTVIQFFKFTSLGRWPTQKELRNMSYMAVAEGANGLFYWSLGTNALAYICDGNGPDYSPAGSGSWCSARVNNHNNLKAVIAEITSLQTALASVDRNNLLAGNSNSNIHTRVKIDGTKAYLIASNYSGLPTSASFTWNGTPTGILAYNEGRTINFSGNSFSDNFAPYEAHVYEVYLNGAPPLPPPLTPLPSSPSLSPLSADFNHDGVVNSLDFSLMNHKWLQSHSAYDLNSDGIINSIDYSVMLTNWTK